MTFPHELINHPLAVTEETLESIANEYAVRILGADVHPEAFLLLSARAQTPVGTVNGSVGILPLTGYLTPKGFGAPMGMPAISMAEWTRNFEGLAAQEEVKVIVLAVDSPGGSVAGVPEAVARMNAARGDKPIVAVSEYLMGSGAYWIGSQANQIVAAPTAKTGGIGVLGFHRAMAGALERQGVNVTLTAAGKFKAEGNPWQPLSEAAIEHMQATTDAYYAMFVADVARGRHTSPRRIRGGYGQGRAYVTAQAIGEGLVDREGTLEETVARLQSPQIRGRLRNSAESIQSPQIDPVDGARLAAAVAKRFDSAGAEPPNG